MSAAQDEVDRILNSEKEIATSHPEDQHDHYDLPSEDEDEQDARREKRSIKQKNQVFDSDSDNDNGDATMLSSKSYHLPSTYFDANTGPKGVIADAQAYERAKKKSFRRTLMDVSGFDPQAFSRPQSRERTSHSGSRTPDGSDDDRFMREWREARMRELQSANVRRSSPSKRRYGTVDVVGANGYLDAVERVTADTVVVVCIYDPEVRQSYSS